MHPGQCPTGGAGVTANTPASRKAKGRKFQQQIRDDLIDRLGIDPGDVQSTAMGQSGCDLYLSPAARERFPFGVECKAQEAIALPAWWKQCTANAKKEELTPLLLIKRSREEPLAVLRWTDLLSLIKPISSSQTDSSDHRWQNLAEGLTGGRP
jgi:hypothetical protein